MEPLNFYTERITVYRNRIKKLRKRIATVAILRLTSFVFLGLSLYFLSRQYAVPLLLISVFFLICFIIFIRVSLNLQSAKQLSEKMLFINENELRVINHGENGFNDGKEIAATAIYRDDLDIFGPRSLYHLLNRTATSHGSEALSALLTSPLRSNKEIAERQEATRHFSTQPELGQLIAAQGLLHAETEGNMNDLSEWMETPQKLAGIAWLNIIRIVLPIWNIAALLYYLSENNPLPLIAGVALSWLIISVFLKYIHTQHRLIGKKQPILEQYGSILQYFGQTDAGNVTRLRSLKEKTASGRQEIWKLSKLAASFDQRLNLVVFMFANSLLLYDVQCMIALEKWRSRNKRHFSEWADCVGSIEALNSLSVFAFNNPGYCYPTVEEGAPFIKATGMAHPLMQLKAPIANDLCVGKEDKLLLVTGSNMSGKSTFLRTVGINLLLAQCGAPVYADTFAFTPMNILSSIRISDSLQDNTSYFMAELKRLHDIIAELEKDAPALVLIDEVLRGTNSDDKTYGSEAFIRKLLRYPCIALFATHDLSLSELEKALPQEVNNYCFESSIENGELLFDYALRRGVAKNKNASFLMEKMGII